MSRATPARLCALEVTRQVRERAAWAHELIEKQVRTAPLPHEERDFAILLILGVVASSGELDALLERSLTHGSIDATVRDALRISTYELFFLHKEPHIAVSQGVELVRACAPHAAGFANKVLRAAAKLRQDFPFGDPAHEPAALAHQQAFPLWLAERIIASLGFDAAAEFMAASNTSAPVFVACLAHGTTVEVPPSELAAWTPRIEAGECIIADASSQKVAALAAPPVAEAGAPAATESDAGAGAMVTEAGTLLPGAPGASSAASRPFLEVGSGRGTKTVLLQRNALRIHGVQPPLFALDLHAFKRDILKERIQRYHLKNVTPITGDATRLDELIAQGQLPGTFGAALIDAPCSGTGTLRRHPEIRWRLTPSEVTAMAAQGLKILQAVARHIAPGGFVLYSTCSVLREENEQLIETFLASQDGAAFTPEPLEGTPYLRTPLTPHSPDAHFAAKLTKRDDAEYDRV